MLADFFMVLEQDSAPIDGPRQRHAKIGDKADAFIRDDAGTPGEGDDFRATFMEVSRRRDEAVSEPMERKDFKMGEDDPPPDLSLEAGTKGEVEGSGRQGEGSLAEGFTRGQAANENGTDEPSTRESGGRGERLTDDAVGGRNNGSEPDKPSTATTVEQKSQAASAGKENPAASSTAAQHFSAKEASVSGRDGLQSADSKGAQRIAPMDGKIDTEAAKRGTQEMKTAMPEAREKGPQAAASEAGASRRSNGNAGGAVPKRSAHGGIITTMTGLRGKESLASVSETGSLKKIDAQAAAKDEKSLASVFEKGSLSKKDGQAGAETQKGDAPLSKGVPDPQGARLADQESGKAGPKIQLNDVSGPKIVVPITGSVSSPGRKGTETDSSATSKKGIASAETASESRKTGSRQGAAVGSLETGKDRQGKDGQRFNLGRDGLGKQDPYKAGPREQRIESAGEKGGEAAANKFANRVSSLVSEQASDRNIPRSETIGSDTSTPSAGNSSASPRASGGIPRFAETETVRRSFQENGVRQLVEKAALNLKEGRQEFRIELKPESLGSVRLQVSTENHQVTIRIITELPIAKEMIENNLSHLRAELQGQGIGIDKCEVSLSDGTDREALNRDFSRSNKMKREMGAKRGTKAVPSHPDAGWEDLAMTGLAGNRVISLFA